MKSRERNYFAVIYSLIHLFIVKTQQTCVHDFKKAVKNTDLHMNKNNKNTKCNVKTHNTLTMPKTRTESSYVFENGTVND